jgi:hypothetical protein
VTSTCLCDLFNDRKCGSGIVQQTMITNNTETVAFTEKAFKNGLYKTAIAQSNDNVRLEVKEANSDNLK